MPHADLPPPHRASTLMDYVDGTLAGVRLAAASRITLRTYAPCRNSGRPYRRRPPASLQQDNPARGTAQSSLRALFACASERAPNSIVTTRRLAGGISSPTWLVSDYIDAVGRYRTSKLIKTTHLKHVPAGAPTAGHQSGTLNRDKKSFRYRWQEAKQASLDRLVTRRQDSMKQPEDQTFRPHHISQKPGKLTSDIVLENRRIDGLCRYQLLLVELFLKKISKRSVRPLVAELPAPSRRRK